MNLFILFQVLNSIYVSESNYHHSARQITQSIHIEQHLFNIKIGKYLRFNKIICVWQRKRQNAISDVGMIHIFAKTRTEHKSE